MAKMGSNISDACPEPIGPATGYSEKPSAKPVIAPDNPQNGDADPKLGGNYHLRTSYGAKVTGR